MTKTDSQTARPAGLVPGDVPFVGWSRAAHEFRIKAAELAPKGVLPLLIGDPGVGKRCMARAWRHVAGLGEEVPIIDLDRDPVELPPRCIGYTTRRPELHRFCFRLDVDEGIPLYVPEDPKGQPTLPGDLFQHFAIALYMPPIHRHREIDLLAHLDYCNKVRFPRAGFRYRGISVPLLTRLFFDNDWPSNLQGLSRFLENVSDLDRREAKATRPRWGIVNLDTLRYRSEIRMLNPPSHRDPEARVVDWICHAEDVPIRLIPALAVGIFQWQCVLKNTDDPKSELHRMLLPESLCDRATAIRARDFLRMTPEEYVNEHLSLSPSIKTPEQAAWRSSKIYQVTHDLHFGATFSSLQAGLAIDPVKADLPSDRAIAVNQVGRSRSAEWRTQSAGAPGQDPQAAGEASEPANRFCIAKGIFHVGFRTAEGRTEEWQFPRDGNLGMAYYHHLIQHPDKGFSALELAREVGRKDAPPEQRYERATAGEGYGSGTSYDPVLDKEGKQKMVERLDAIDRELVEAKRKDHQGRIEKLEEEQKFINAELKGAIHIRKEDYLYEIDRQLRSVDQDLEEAIRDGDPPSVIQELVTKRQVLAAERKKVVQSRKDRNLDKEAGQARDSIRKAMEDARTKLILHGLPGLARYLKEAVMYKNGSWTYRPSKSSRDWLT